MEAVNSNSKEAVRLCEHIVRGAFGDVVCVSYGSCPFESL